MLRRAEYRSRENVRGANGGEGPDFANWEITNKIRDSVALEVATAGQDLKLTGYAYCMLTVVTTDSAAPAAP